MGVPVTGQITAYAGGTYATIDAILGLPPVVADATALNAITALRRRQGMLVVVQADIGDGTLKAYQLTAASPWAFTSADWTLYAAGGSGTVTTVSVVSTHGFAGTVATATTTPAITLSTTITGLLKGDGTSISTAGASDLPSTGLTITQHAGAIGTGSIVSTTCTFDLSTHDWYTLTLSHSATTTLALSNPTTGQQFTIILVQDGTGGCLVTWFTTIKWAGGAAPTLTTAIGGIDVLTFKCVSSGQYYGFVAGQGLA